MAVNAPDLSVVVGRYRLQVRVSSGPIKSDRAATSIKVEGVREPSSVQIPGASFALDADSEIPLLRPILAENSLVDVYLRGPDVSTLRAEPRSDALSLQFEDKGIRHYRLRLRGNVGFLTLTWQAPGLEISIRLEVFPTKMDYRRDYSRLLEDLHTLSPMLVTSTSGLTAGHFSSEFGSQTTDLEWLLNLQHGLAKLEAAMDVLVPRLRPAVRRSIEVRPTDRLRGRKPVSRAVQSRILSPGMPRRLIATQSVGTERATSINRYVKREVHRLRDTCNSILRADWSRKLDPELIAIVARASGLAQKWTSEMLDIPDGPEPRELGVHLRDPFYGPAINSFRVLRNELSRTPNARLVGLKDLPTLYEYWVFLAVARILLERFPVVHTLREPLVRRAGSGLVLVAGRRSEIVLGDDDGTIVRCQFNRQFNGLPTTNQRPDTVIEVSSQEGLLIIDAKYRVARDENYLRRYGNVGPLEEDVNVLHRYRDAIVDPRRPGQRLSRNGLIVFPSGAGDTYRRHHFFRSWLSAGIGGMPMLPDNVELMREALEAHFERFAEVKKVES